MSLFDKRRRTRWVRLDSPHHVRLRVEELESRLVPSGTGNAWTHPERITLSFVPDGTVLAGNITSNLFATFNAHPGWTTDTWQHEIIKAAQYWAQQADINFDINSDSGASSGSGSYQQGDSQFGDIRIGGYNMGASVLGGAYLPPPVNNFSITGDIDFNTSKGFNIGTTYDLFTVAVHEIGHALGLDHSTVSSAVMYASYNGVKSSLTADDISSIQGVYDARSADMYDAVVANNSFLTATNLTAQINPTTLTTLQTGLDITTTSDPDYYTFAAPLTTSSTLKVKVQTAGLSLLRQAVLVYADDQTTVLGSASSVGYYDGTTRTITINGVTPGQVFYVKVFGADTSAFGTGAYALALNFGTGATPNVPLPNTQTLNGTPLQGGGSMNETTAKQIEHGKLPETFDLLRDDGGSGARGVSPPSRGLLRRLEDLGGNREDGGQDASLSAPLGVPANSLIASPDQAGLEDQARASHSKTEAAGPAHGLVPEQISDALFAGGKRFSSPFGWSDAQDE